MEAYFDYLAQLELLDLIDSLISDSENESDEENDSGNENGSDDENEHVEQTENIFQLVKYNVLDLFDDAHCRKVFRFDKPTILYITGLVEHLFPVIKTNCSFTRVQPIHLVLIALQFYATGRLQTEIGILLRMTEQSVSKAVECVSNALFSIAREHIKFPANLHALKQDFHSIALLPGVVGCIDGTHFRISRPSEYGEAYQNRTGRYSVNAQAICDAQCRLLSFNVTRPGSMRDSVIFKQSNIAQSFASGKYGEGYLLGDSGYLCTPYLLTPFRNPSTRPEETFNSALKSTRCTIERTFGLLKRRFSCLDGQLDLKPGNVGRLANWDK